MFTISRGSEMEVMSQVLSLLAFCSLFCLNYGALSGGMLFPRESESRMIQELEGMWNFRADMSPSRDAGIREGWYTKPLSKTGRTFRMPVPSSYNDIMTDKTLRDFVGWVWYDREVFVDSAWANKRVVLRFDSAHYYSRVWVNGRQVMQHAGGHLPFEAVVNNFIHFGKRNLITVAINNTLTPTTIPPGTIQYMDNRNMYPEGYFVQNLQFDFFNYAGIHRRVRLYSTPETYVDDITITTDISATGSTGYVTYQVKTGGPNPAATSVQVVDTNNTVISTQNNLQGQFIINNAYFWWPYTMSKDQYGYRYHLAVTIQNSRGDIDVYRQPFGIRTVKVTNTQWLINNRPFYCLGVNKHEDSDIRGKGLDFPLIARDFAMMKWMGSNCFRTSHYPYAEEILEEADIQGIVVIAESPGVGLKTRANFQNATLVHHMQVMEEMIRRDKNHPGIAMWSVANEPSANLPEALPYFRDLITFTRNTDPSGRPVTFASGTPIQEDQGVVTSRWGTGGHKSGNKEYYEFKSTLFALTRKLDSTRPVTYIASDEYAGDKKVAMLTDIQCINRYYGWYQDTGHTELISRQLSYDLQQWHNMLNKPLIVSEYGADTIPGLHSMPQYVFTEDYQLEFMQQYHTVFDSLRPQYLVGELVWNFADFMTTESVTRVFGNRKGMLTRQRQPKAAGHFLRERYHSLVNMTRPAFLRSNKIRSLAGQENP